MITTCGSPNQIKETIRAEALRLGFSACGFAKAGRVSAEMEARVRQWLAEGGNGGMTYMANNLEKRLDPRLLMPGVKTIVSVALNYAPARRLPEGEPQISAYALGKDYHEVVKVKLRKLATFCVAIESGTENLKSQTSNLKPQISNLKPQIYCDTAPVLERYWAVQAGLGWIGRNHQLIIPHAGSMFFLGELFLDFELPCDKPMASRCGSCHRCVDACPTGALASPRPLSKGEGRLGVGSPCEANVGRSMQSADVVSPSPLERGGGEAFFDSSLCLSYQTIENRGELSETAKKAMGDTFYGCDRCQAACPWNRFATPNATPEFQPSDELLGMTRERWKTLTVDEYRRLFKGSAVKRAKYDGLMRNIRNLP